MKNFLVIMSVLAACSATPVLQPFFSGPTTYFRTPSLDTSYVESSQVGGNFAYRTVSGPAYQAVTPLTYAAYPAYPGYSYFPNAPLIPTGNFLPPINAAPSRFYPAIQPGIYYAHPQGAPAAAPAMPAPAESAPESKREELDDGQQVDEDTVAVESIWILRMKCK